MLLPHEKHVTAVHEAGHALCAALCEHADPVAKVTILPAGQTLGVTEQLPLVERHMFGEDYLADSLTIRLAGRAAELLILGQGSTGAANDLAQATELATKMVREFGLSRVLGPIGYPSNGSAYFGSNGTGLSYHPYAEATQAAIDAEVARLLREAQQRALDLLTTHQPLLERLADLLVHHETVAGSVIYELTGTPRTTDDAADHTATVGPAIGPALSATAGTPAKDVAPAWSTSRTADRRSPNLHASAGPIRRSEHDR